MSEPQKVVLVTGASAGFGRQTAVEAARRGYRSFASMRDPGGKNAAAASELAATARNEGLALEVIELDVHDDQSVSRAVDSVIAGAGRIDGVVNNAGFGVIGPWETISVSDAQAQLETNLFGAHRVSLAVVPHMREQRTGTIVNVSSDSGVRPTPFEAFYAASKFALEAMSEVMRYELQQFGIRVCCVNPGWYGGTAFDDRMISTVDWERPAEPYTQLVERFSAAQGRKEGPQENTGQVAAKAVDLIEADAPPFRNFVGCSPLRTAEYASQADYERALFEFYEIEALRGPWAAPAPVSPSA